MSGVHLAAQLASATTVAEASQWLLMPALAAMVAAETGGRTRLVRWMLAGLALSWLGDVAPDFASGDTAFLTMIGFFLLAQLAYIAGFTPYRHESVLRRAPGVVAGYGAAVVALVAGCAAGAGSLLVPALVYGVVLATMAVLATGLGRAGAVGGALFFVSDAMIALDAFAVWFTPPATGLWIMATYIGAQTLLSVAVIEHSRRSAAPSSVAQR